MKLITPTSEDTSLPIRKIDPSQIQPHLAFATVFDELGNQATDKAEQEYCERLAERQRHEVEMALRNKNSQ